MAITKFQLDYLTQLVQEEFKKEEAALLASIEPEILCELEEFYEQPHAIQYRAMLQEWLTLREQEKIIAERKTALVNRCNTLCNEFFEKCGELKFNSHNEMVYDNVLGHHVPIDREAIFLTAARRIVLPIVTKNTGVAEKLALLRERGRNAYQKIMLATNLRALREAIALVNEYMGLKIEI